MPGNRIGGLKTAEKIRAKNPNHWKEIGAKGGSRSSGGGFATKSPCFCDLIQGEHTKPQCAGRRGGSARGYKQRVIAKEVISEQV